MIVSLQDGNAPGLAVRGASLVIQDWPAEGLASEVAPLHVHRGDDEAWHVVSGALRFRFADEGGHRQGCTRPGGPPDHRLGQVRLGRERHVIRDAGLAAAVPVPGPRPCTLIFRMPL